jgi:hypothetical protein
MQLSRSRLSTRRFAKAACSAEVYACAAGPAPVWPAWIHLGCDIPDRFIDVRGYQCLAGDRIFDLRQQLRIQRYGAGDFPVSGVAVAAVPFRSIFSQTRLTISLTLSSMSRTCSNVMLIAVSSF